MKKNLILILICTGFFQSVTAQFSQDFEAISCNRANLTAPNDCWTFSAISTTSPAINGCSAQSGALSNPALNQYTMTTPALNIAATAVVSFNYKATNTTSNPSFSVTAIDVSTNVETTIWSQAAPLPTSTTAVSFTFPIAPGAGNYRIVFKPTGSGGASRVQIDDINITNATQIETYSGSPGTCGVVILPLTLIDFNGSNASNGINIHWKVAQEIMSGYELQVSEDGVVFTTIASIPAINNSLHTEYSYVDKNSYLSNPCYYRLKLIEPSFSVNYSKVIIVKNAVKINTLIIYPNPTKDCINIYFNGPVLHKKATITLLAIDGRVLLRSIVNTTNRSESINISNFPSGKYILNIVTNSEEINKVVDVIK